MTDQDSGNIIDLILTKKDFRLLLVLENLSKEERGIKGHDSTAIEMGMDVNAIHRALAQDNDTLSYKFLCCIFFFVWQRRELFKQFKAKMKRMNGLADEEALSTEELTLCTMICKACLDIARNDEFLMKYMDVSIYSYNSEIGKETTEIKSRKVFDSLKRFIGGAEFQNCLNILNCLIEKVTNNDFVDNYWSRIINAEKVNGSGRVKFRLGNS